MINNLARCNNEGCSLGSRTLEYKVLSRRAAAGKELNAVESGCKIKSKRRRTSSAYTA